jgi:hypothetical protein
MAVAHSMPKRDQKGTEICIAIPNSKRTLGQKWAQMGRYY